MIHLLSPPRPLRPASAEEIARARPIIERAPETYPHLVRRGDKALLFSRAGHALLMYGRIHPSWIAMGDPIGSKNEARELVWQFRDLCHRQRAWPVFFEVGSANLDLYLDLGLALTKLGEEARVALSQSAQRKSSPWTSCGT
jgi:phosphatidylglycerol lysyltransferase